jgi:hypothetical protein
VDAHEVKNFLAPDFPNRTVEAALGSDHGAGGQEIFFGRAITSDIGSQFGAWRVCIWSQICNISDSRMGQVCPRGSMLWTGTGKCLCVSIWFWSVLWAGLRGLVRALIGAEESFEIQLWEVKASFY